MLCFSLSSASFRRISIFYLCKISITLLICEYSLSEKCMSLFQFAELQSLPAYRKKCALIRINFCMFWRIKNIDAALTIVFSLSHCVGSQLAM